MRAAIARPRTALQSVDSLRSPTGRRWVLRGLLLDCACLRRLVVARQGVSLLAAPLYSCAYRCANRVRPWCARGRVATAGGRRGDRALQRALSRFAIAARLCAPPAAAHSPFPRCVTLRLCSMHPRNRSPRRRSAVHNGRRWRRRGRRRHGRGLRAGGCRVDRERRPAGDIHGCGHI